MHSIQINGRKRKIASTWNELTPKAFLHILRILLSAHDLNQKKILCLKHVLDIPNHLFYAFTPVQMCQLLYCTDFLFKENNLTKQLLPQFNIGILSHQKLYGPGNDFENMTFDEFINADTHFLNYFKAHKPETKTYYLNKFIACLYREKETDSSKMIPGDLRTKFDVFSVEERIRKVKGLKELTKQAIVTWFQGCRNHCEKLFPEVFPKVKTNSKGKGADWNEVLLTLPNDKLGPIKDIEQQYVHTVLLLMNKIIKDTEK